MSTSILKKNPIVPLINKIDDGTDIIIQAFTNGSSVTVSYLRESNGTAQSSWYTLANLPTGYRPLYEITAYFNHGDNSNVDRFRIATNGDILLYGPQTGQMGGIITFSI